MSYFEELRMYGVCFSQFAVQQVGKFILLFFSKKWQKSYTHSGEFCNNKKAEEIFFEGFE